MSFQPLSEFLDPTLTLPVTPEKSYTIPAPSMRTGLYCELVERLALKREVGEELTDAEVEMLTLDDEGERDFYKQILGSAYDEMLADDIPWPVFSHVAHTVLTWINHGRAAAERAWEAPKAPTPKQPQDRKASGKSARQGSTGHTKRPRKQGL